MADKWIKDAAREIDSQYAIWDQDDADKRGYVFGQDRLDVIETIILKHCPEDKGVERSVEALEGCISWMQATNYLARHLNPNFGGTELKTSEATVKVLNRAKAALAAYEKETK